MYLLIVNCLLSAFGNGEVPDYDNFSIKAFLTKMCVQNTTPKVASCAGKHLQYVPGYLLHDLRHLDLKRNDFTMLVNHSFRKYSFLETFDLSYNDIHFIEIYILCKFES